MINFISKVFARSDQSTPVKKDDFSVFFLDSKARDKKKIIKQIMREATAEQEKVMKEYRERTT